MIRKPDWETRLAAWLETCARRPHAYGKLDCLLFAAGGVRAVTGRDFSLGHRGRYRTAGGAARYLRRLGFRTSEALIDSLLEERPVALAQRGDLVLADGVPGVCIGGEALFVGEAGGAPGFVRKPRTAWSKAWAVGSSHE